MRLRSLRVRNYRRFRSADLRFPDGLIGVVGRNGAGKSTLLEAVLWCLYGHEAARTQKDLIKHESAAPGDDVEARIEFELDGADFAVTRRLRGRSLQPEAAVESNGQLLVAPGANSWDQTNAYLERLVGLPRQAFESTVVAKQGELAALAELRPLARKRFLLGLLGIDRLESAISAARGEARVLEARLAQARRELEEEGRLRADRERSESERARAQARTAELEAAAATARAAAAESAGAARHLLEQRMQDQEIRARLDALQGRLDSIRGQRSRTAAETNILRERLAERAPLEARLSQIGDIDAELARWQHRRLLEQRWTRLNEELDLWRPRTDAHAINGSSPESLQADVRRLQADLQEGRVRLARLEAESTLLGERLGGLVAGGDGTTASGRLRAKDPCPTCGRPLGKALEALRDRAAKERGDARRRHGEVQERLGILVPEVAQTETALDERRRALDEVNRRIHEASVASLQVERIERERTAVRSQIEGDGSAPTEAGRDLEALRAERDGIRDRLARLGEAAARLDRLSEEDRVLRAQERQTYQDRELASRELQRVGYVEGAWQDAHGEAEERARTAEGLERELVQWRERAEAWTRECAGLEERLERLAERRRESEGWSTELGVLELLAAPRTDQGLLAEFRAHLVGRVRPILSRAASGLLREMTGGRYAELTLDEDYTPCLYDGGLAYPLERFSGGEADVASLALRLGVSEVVSGFRGRVGLQFVALDEVFGSQDADRRASVVRALHALRPAFRQIFVVTHHEDVRERLEHVLRVEDTGDGTSGLVPSWDDKA